MALLLLIAVFFFEHKHSNAPKAMRKTVWAFITREHEEGLQILVFSPNRSMKSSIDVPSGRVDDGEQEVEALYRIIEDETGLVHLRFLGKVDSAVEYRGSIRKSEERTSYQVESLELPKDQWTYTVDLDEKDATMQRFYHWLPIKMAYQSLPRCKKQSLRHLFKGDYPLNPSRNRLHKMISTHFPQQSPL
ncbi:MAG: NUDIX hydrolase [Bacteroidota bacterium]